MTIVNPSKPEMRLIMITLNQKVMMIDIRNYFILFFDFTQTL